jgi:hypothetical protein
MTTPNLIGKYFIGIHDDGLRSGVVEAAVNDTHFLVRFDRFFCAAAPEPLAVVPIAEMISIVHGDDEFTMCWNFFDSEEQRAAYQAWVDAPPVDGKPTHRWLNS